MGGSGRRAPPAWLERRDGKGARALPRDHSIDGFQTFQTFPTRSGPGFSVGLPGSQPAGMASLPPLARTCWKACTWRMVSASFLPTGGVITSIAWMMPSGSMMKRPRSSTPWDLSQTP